MFKLFCFILIIGKISAQVGLYGQCGGQLYTGPTNCAQGLACLVQNQYYSQCLPGFNTITTTQPSLTRPPGQISTDGYFTAKNGTLYDANGKEFLIRGVNSAHLWFDNHDRDFAYKSLLPISRTNTNTVRIVWGLNLQGMPVGQLEKIIKRVIELKMIPMIELHDATGSSDVNSLLDCAKWFKDNMNLFMKYKKYVLINIANEWSPWGTPLESKQNVIFNMLVYIVYQI
jgi:hypothetical protein